MQPDVETLDNTDWTQVDAIESEEEKCEIHDFGINEFGIIQCKDCKTLVMGNAEREVIKPDLKKRFDYLWRDGMENLRRTRSLLRLNRYDCLKREIVDYKNSDGSYAPSRTFYSERSI